MTSLFCDIDHFFLVLVLLGVWASLVSSGWWGPLSDPPDARFPSYTNWPWSSVTSMALVDLEVDWSGMQFSLFVFTIFRVAIWCIAGVWLVSARAYSTYWWVMHTNLWGPYCSEIPNDLACTLVRSYWILPQGDTIGVLTVQRLWLAGIVLLTLLSFSSLTQLASGRSWKQS